MKKHINIIRLSGKLHVCPDLHDTEKEAMNSLELTLGKYRTPHLQFVTKPIEIEVPDAPAVPC